MKFVVGMGIYDDAEEAAEALLKHDDLGELGGELLMWKAHQFQTLAEFFCWDAEEHGKDPDPCWVFSSILEEMAEAEKEELIEPVPGSFIGVIEDDWFVTHAHEDAEALGSADEPATVEITVKVTI